MVEKVVKAYPNVKVVGTTLREVKSGLVNNWSAILYVDGKFYESRRFDNLEIEDRVGGGDGFSSGFAYGFLNGKTPQECVDLGAAHGALLQTTRGDTSQIDLEELNHVFKGGSAGSSARRPKAVRILLTTTSFQDTPGAHHDALRKSGFEIVTARGPLSESEMLDLVQTGFDGLLNGDDHITAKVIDAALPKLSVIAKYGIGLDSIDVKYATAKKIPVLFTPGVNHTTVAEHCFGLMIALAKHFWPHLRSTKSGGWKRITGNELFGKTIAVLGVGRIGKEVIKRAVAFDMKLIGFDRFWDHEFGQQYNVQRRDDSRRDQGSRCCVAAHESRRHQPRLIQQGFALENEKRVLSDQHRARRIGR